MIFNKRVLWAVVGLGFITLTLIFAKTPKQEPLRYSLGAKTKTVMRQDFTRLTKLDSHIWNNKGVLPWGTKKNQATGEIQDYVKEAVQLTPEGLCLTARQKNGVWTSGSVDTQGKFLFQPDTITTIRYKLPQHSGKMAGFTPSLWMGYEPTKSGEWRWPPEVDVIEALGQDGFKIAHTTLHYDADNKTIYNVESYINKLDGVYTYPGPDVSQGWNTAIVDRRHRGLIISHNQIVTLKITNPRLVPQEPMFLIVSFPIGVGGNGWAGMPDGDTPDIGKFCIASIQVEKAK